jgi:hypothetical protein
MAIAGIEKNVKEAWSHVHEGKASATDWLEVGVVGTALVAAGILALRARPVLKCLPELEIVGKEAVKLTEVAPVFGDAEAVSKVSKVWPYRYGYELKNVFGEKVSENYWRQGHAIRLDLPSLKTLELKPTNCFSNLWKKLKP